MKIEAEMSGSVWKVEVKEGDLVNAGDVVIILESMKMEIPIEATTSGKVEEVSVAEGDFVQEGEMVVLLSK